MQLRMMYLLLFFRFICTAQDKTEDFDQFCKSFFSDRAFQVSRIAFPLVKVQITEDLEDVDTILVQRQDWQYSDFGYGKKRDQTTDNWEIRLYDNFALKKSKRLTNTTERVVGFEGIDNGISVHLYFELRGSKWTLVKFQDLST